MTAALSCRSTAPRIVYHHSFIYDNQRYHEVTAQDLNIGSDSTATVTGIYQIATAKSQSPCLKIFRSKTGFLRVPLTSTVKAKKNSLVKISGKWEKKKQSMLYLNRSFIALELFPQKFSSLFDCEKFVPTLDSTYREFLPGIQKQITIKNSKLKLSQKPKWDFFYLEDKNRILAISQQYDLMYAASIEFVINPQNSRIEMIQAKEWFKGEMD